MRSSILSLALVLASLYACSNDPDPLAGTLAQHGASSKGGDDDDDAKPASKPPPAATPSDAGAAPAPAPAAPATNAFTTAATFSLVTPSDESSNHHDGDSNAGKDCLGCHTGEGAPQFVIGGTVWASKAGAEGATGVEVRVVSATGEELALVGTDSDGNFWLEGTDALPAGASVGVRTTATTQTMVGKVQNGSCNQTGCHADARPMFLSN